MIFNLDIALSEKAINRGERDIAQSLSHYPVRAAAIIILPQDHLPHDIHTINIMPKEGRVNEIFVIFQA